MAVITDFAAMRTFIVNAIKINGSTDESKTQGKNHRRIEIDIIDTLEHILTLLAAIGSGGLGGGALDFQVFLKTAGQKVFTITKEYSGFIYMIDRSLSPYPFSPDTPLGYTQNENVVTFQEEPEGPILVAIFSKGGSDVETPPPTGGERIWEYLTTSNAATALGSDNNKVYCVTYTNLGADRTISGLPAPTAGILEYVIINEDPTYLLTIPNVNKAGRNEVLPSQGSIRLRTDGTSNFFRKVGS